MEPESLRHFGVIFETIQLPADNLSGLRLKRVCIL
jgi:hypothetical protein